MTSSLCPHTHSRTRMALRRSPVLVAALLALGAQAAVIDVTSGADSGLMLAFY